MLIEKLRLKNYRQYVDVQIDFPHSRKGKHITIIEGPNGSGKTNILNAITWCLYGKEMHLGDKNKGLPILSTTILNSIDVDSISEVEVELTVLDSDGTRMNFKRQAPCRKSLNNMVEELGSKLSVLYQEGHDWKRSDYPENIVEQHIPEDIHNYFFFDCERLDDYFKSGSKYQPIRKEVFKISQLALFEAVTNHLRKRNDEYAKKLKEDNPAAEKTLEVIKHKTNRLEAIKKELDDLWEKEKEAEALEKEMAEKLKSYPSSHEVNKLQEDRERLYRLCEDLERDIKETQERQKKFLIKMAPLIICYDPIQNAMQLISGKIDKGEIPPEYKRSFLKKLLDTSECICGTDLQAESTGRANIEKLLRECDEITNITEELIREKFILKHLSQEVKTFRDTQISNSKLIMEKESEHKTVNTKLNEIAIKLKKIDDEKITRWERNLQTAQKHKEAYIEHRGMLKQRMRDLEKEIEGLDKKYHNELEKMNKNKELKRTLLFCNNSIKAAEEVKEEIMEEIRGDVEKRTREQFFELIWKQSNYKTITISKDYEISVTDQTDREAIGTLSAGERQVLALSFMAALNMVSGFNAPLIIDTPLGRISREPKLNIAEKLPSYLEGKQLTLLVTEEENTPEVRRKLSKDVGKEYRIIFHERREGDKAEVVSYE